ncbi:hypothetical protein M514_09059 [Trichuris suis]|uniref:Uncharacterized protein n=1 Tax=Trichuris suis TaxID=68888 RepID=A0A085MRD1_9BILA|nr:hypothetical protein M513_09059 [Trichuris suis]KFD59777.1 hypothetical protein M514_09059 [Trichuris suis]
MLNRAYIVHTAIKQQLKNREHQALSALASVPNNRLSRAPQLSMFVSHTEFSNLHSLAALLLPQIRLLIW